jgi:hypothetical protein
MPWLEPPKLKMPIRSLSVADLLFEQELAARGLHYANECNCHKLNDWVISFDVDDSARGYSRDVWLELVNALGSHVFKFMKS